VAGHDEPLNEATLSLHLRKLVQDQIDRSFKLGLTGYRAKPKEGPSTSHGRPINGAEPKTGRRT